MNARQRKKTLRKFCDRGNFLYHYFVVPKRRRYKEVIVDLDRQLDGLMEYHYGRYCK